MAEPASNEWSDVGAEQGASTTPIPDKTGRYRILCHLGSGGMGSVYLAEQTEPVHRRVALKVTHAFESEPDRARFAVEA
ncbi:MAG: hypothetical protein AAGA68_20335 [Pseudomonadota bacterium]